MEAYRSLAGIGAGLVAVGAFVPYIQSILRRRTKPNRVSYAIWSAIGLVSAASYLASGARETAWIAVAYAVLQLVVLGLSFHYGVGGLAKLDLV